MISGSNNPMVIGEYGGDQDGVQDPDNMDEVLKAIERMEKRGGS